MRTAGMVSGMAIERFVAHLAASENVGDRVTDQFADALSLWLGARGLEKERDIALSFEARRECSSRIRMGAAPAQIEPS